MKRKLFLFLFLGAFTIANAQDKTPLRLTQYNISSSELALSGYDAVNYFSGKPQKGKEAFVLNYGGVNYRFANVQNKTAFQQNPSTYEPQYGGWCAYAMGNDGSKVEVDPETYKYKNGVKKEWDKDRQNLIIKADAQWTA